jgi:response regulator of citrate/malate metabolism
MPRRSQIYRGREREIVYRMLIDILREYHSGYSHVNEPFGMGVETLLIAACVALGDLEDKPFSASKVAAYLGVPRTTVIRRLEKLEKAGGSGLPNRPPLPGTRTIAQLSERDADVR